MQQYGSWRLRLVDKRAERGAVSTFSFESLSPMDFRAGQYLHLAAVSENWDKPMVRHMSIASPPGERLLEFTMDLGSGTEYKRAMDALRVGDRVTAFKLKGEFLAPEGDGVPLVFIAGGLGITPIRSILQDLAARKSSAPRTLFHVARDGHLFEEELAALNLPQRRTDRAGLDALWPAILDAAGAAGKFYIAGSERFVSGMRSRLQDSRIGEGRIVVENFR